MCVKVVSFDLISFFNEAQTHGVTVSNFLTCPEETPAA